MMQTSPESPDHSECPICHAEIPPATPFCTFCGARIPQTPTQEILSLNYLLAELDLWETEGLINLKQAENLRETYELRRQDLRAQLPESEREKITSDPQQKAAPPRSQKEPAWTTAPPPPPGFQEAHAASTEPFIYPGAVAPLEKGAQSSGPARVPQRTLLERLSDPHTIRILLYTGAGMLVVGVVIWLRDILYLKLQEPIVQAALLAIGTIVVTVSGWLVILRTRLLLTGRALTLTGSLLVPVNFWFLARSGLIENNGRAWIVCALCSLLYAHTAALLREKLYVYLSSIAAIATAWTLVYRYEREAPGLYALTLSAISLIFLHLSRLFPKIGGEPGAANDKGQPYHNPQSALPNTQSLIARASYELWGPPLVHVALTGVTLAAIAYMPWRTGSTSSFEQGIFRLLEKDYDPSIAILLSAGLAYAVWFAGRYIYTNTRRALYLTSLLTLFWIEFLTVDGLRLSGSVQVLVLSATALIVAITARMVKGDVLPLALHRASLVVSVVMALFVYAFVSAVPVPALTHGAILIFIAATFAIASAPRFRDEAAVTVLAHASAIFASAAFLVTLISFQLESRTLFYTACAAWPFVLSLIAFLLLAARRETQLSEPFRHVADAASCLLLITACGLTLALDQALRSGNLMVDNLPGRFFPLLTGAVIYGWWRGWRKHSIIGVGLMSVALLVLVAATGDTLKHWNALPAAWPVATAVIIAAFLLREAARKLLRPEIPRTARGGSRFSKATDSVSRAALIGIIADCFTTVSALLWFASAVNYYNQGGTSAAVVLFIALLYWVERAARLRRPWATYVSATHMGALCLTLLIAQRVEAEWFACASLLILFPLLFAASRYAQARRLEWIAGPAGVSAGTVFTIAAGVSLLQVLAHLQLSDPGLLAPSVTLGAGALLSFAASLWSDERARIRYFRSGLISIILSFAFLCLHAGFDPISNVEIYSVPVAILLLLIAYLAARRDWKGYETDVDLLLWVGSLLLSVPLLLHALNFRLTEVPAPWRDLATLCASLALLLLGVTGRLRAPLIVGVTTLSVELIALTATSVGWLQIPLKVYLISTGALILLIWGGLEFRREQILRLRQRLHERREYARERFGEWR